MTSSLSASSVIPTHRAGAVPPGDHVPHRGLRVLLATVAVLATVPYLALKVAWLTGSNVGLTSSDMLGNTTMEVANALTGGMELVAAVTAIMLAGRAAFRVPIRLWHLPGFVATGLLGGILVVLPIQLVLGVSRPAQSAVNTGPIAEWVYSMVYGGFALLGMAWLALFGMHVAQRSRPVSGWKRPLAEVPVPRARLAGVAPAVTAAVSGAAMVVVAVAEVAGYASMGVVGGHPIMALVMSAVAAASLIALARCRPLRLPRWIPVVGGYAGCAAVTCWGLYFTIVLALPNPLVGDQAIPAWLFVTSVLRVVTGAVATWILSRLVRD